MKNASNRQASVWYWKRIEAGELDFPGVKQWLQGVASEVLKTESLKAADMRAALPRALRLDGPGGRVADTTEKIVRVLQRAGIRSWSSTPPAQKRRLRPVVAREALGRAKHPLNQDGALDVAIVRALKAWDAQLIEALSQVLKSDAGLGLTKWQSAAPGQQAQARHVAALLLGDVGGERAPQAELDWLILKALENN